jgi:hypothetical protein
MTNTDAFKLNAHIMFLTKEEIKVKCNIISSKIKKKSMDYIRLLPLFHESQFYVYTTPYCLFQL